MHVITRKRFDEAIKSFPNDAKAIDDLFRALKRGKFKTPEEIKKAFPSYDNFKYKDKWNVIDINGGNLRMIAYVDLTTQQVFVKHIVTHPEYEKITDKHRKGKK